MWKTENREETLFLAGAILVGLAVVGYMLYQFRSTPDVPESYYPSMSVPKVH